MDPNEKSANLCQFNGCNAAQTIKGWCARHWGSCEHEIAPGKVCGATATARAAIEYVELIGDTRHTKLIGMPLLCAEHHKIVTRRNEATSSTTWQHEMKKYADEAADAGRAEAHVVAASATMKQPAKSAAKE
jgi:hypothetical protein